jgi:homoserine kinase
VNDAPVASCRVRVPATTANLGPGFDCLGMALDLWNDMRFSLEGDGVSVTMVGDVGETLPTDETNLVARSFLRLY